MAGLDGKLLSGSLEGARALKLIPLVIRYAAGVPSVLQNPLNEGVTLTDTGVGVLGVTLSSAGESPLFVMCEVRPTDPTVLGLVANINGAPTSSAFSICVNSGADGATETDPVDLHLLIIKQVSA